MKEFRGPTGKPFILTGKPFISIPPHPPPPQFQSSPKTETQKPEIWKGRKKWRNMVNK